MGASGCQRAAPPQPAPDVAASPTKANPTPVKMTQSQTMGVDILKALNKNSGMKGHSISVGTSNKTVFLNGQVNSAAQKQLAETVAKQRAKGWKISNELQVKVAKK